MKYHLTYIAPNSFAKLTGVLAGVVAAILLILIIGILALVGDSSFVTDGAKYLISCTEFIAAAIIVGCIGGLIGGIVLNTVMAKLGGLVIEMNPISETPPAPLPTSPSPELPHRQIANKSKKDRPTHA